MSGSPDRKRWLTILGVGEEGVEGLSPSALALLTGAEWVVGGERHLALLDGSIPGERTAWPRPMGDVGTFVGQRRGRSVVVLASGDPFDCGIGVQLARAFPLDEMLCIPSASAFSLACARLGWSRQQTRTLSFCGRPIAPLVRALHPGQRIIALSADAQTPAAIAESLRERGFGRSRFHLLEALGGPRERIRQSCAADFGAQDVQPLNVVAIEVQANPGARIIPLSCGLEDDLFEHDGQITKREIRALTLSALAPRAGELLWDVGCGSGSVSIEWLMRHEDNRAIAIESAPERARRATRNALALGTPHLQVIEGEAPQVLASLPAPDAVFLGGGAHRPGLIRAAWGALRPGGRIVANGVVVETEAALIAAQSELGGTLCRLSIERLDAVGRYHAFRPAMAVTQWCAQKS
jgi:precorrin-6Y C5,15-methyltransferase (decarboxylating)